MGNRSSEGSNVMASADEQPNPAIPCYAFDCWIEQDWSNPGNGRYYHAALQQDLFCNWILVQRWGTIFSNRGRCVEKQCGSYEDGLSLLATVAKRRCQRGYVRENSSYEDSQASGTKIPKILR